MSNASLYEQLRDRCRRFRVRHYLEIGVRDGDSLRVVLEEAGQHLESVWLADLWGSDYGGTGRGSHAHIEQLLQDFGFDGRPVFLDGDSRNTLPALLPQKARAFDLVLVDGDHSEAVGLADLRNAWPLVRPGGTLLFHDITHPEHLYLADVFDAFVAGIDNVSEHRQILEPYGVGIICKA